MSEPINTTSSGDAADASCFPDITILLGYGRSGTTYLASVLREVESIGFAGEPKFVEPLCRGLDRFGDLEDPANLQRLAEQIHGNSGSFTSYLHQKLDKSSSADEIVKLVREPSYRGVVYAVFELLADKQGKSRLGYKDPKDTMHLPLLADLLPTSRFIHIVRDGRDVALSTIRQRWGSTNVFSASAGWAWVVRKCRADGAALPEDRYLEIRYEDLIGDTKSTVGRLAEFLHCGPNPESEERLFEYIERTKVTDRVGAGKRTLTPRQRRIFEAVAADVQQECGYATEFDPRPTISSWRAAGYRCVDLLRRIPNRIFHSPLKTADFR
jgi:hypothetical protein